MDPSQPGRHGQVSYQCNLFGNFIHFSEYAMNQRKVGLDWETVYSMATQFLLFKLGRGHVRCLPPACDCVWMKAYLCLCDSDVTKWKSPWKEQRSSYTIVLFFEGGFHNNLSAKWQGKKGKLVLLWLSKENSAEQVHPFLRDLPIHPAA